MVLLCAHRGVPDYGWLLWAGTWCTPSPRVTADMIVVLAGDFSGNRILIAGDLVRQGFAKQALVSGPAGAYGMYESDLAIPLCGPARVSGILFRRASERFAFHGGRSRRRLSPELRARHVHRVDIVTSNYHTRRAGNIYRSQAPDLDIHMVAAPDPTYTPDGWWKNRDARKTFLLEWMKTVRDLVWHVAFGM